MFYSADKTEDLSPGLRISYHSERLFQRGRRRAREYGGFYNEDQILGNRYLKEFIALL